MRATLGIILAWALLFPFQAEAHRLIVFAWVEGDQVIVESKFSNGKKVQGGAVRLIDPSNGDKTEKGETDLKGQFTFFQKEPAPLKIEVDAGQGHRGEWDLVLEDWQLPDLPTSPTKINAEISENQKVPSSSEGVLISEERLRQIIGEEVDKKTKPIVRLLGDSLQPGPSFKDVLGGFGTIFGLVGLASFFRYRKLERERQKNDP